MIHRSAKINEYATQVTVQTVQTVLATKFGHAGDSLCKLSGSKPSTVYAPRVGTSSLQWVVRALIRCKNGSLFGIILSICCYFNPVGFCWQTCSRYATSQTSTSVSIKLYSTIFTARS